MYSLITILKVFNNKKIFENGRKWQKFQNLFAILSNQDVYLFQIMVAPCKIRNISFTKTLILVYPISKLEISHLQKPYFTI